MKKIYPVFFISLCLLWYLSGCKGKPEKREEPKREAVSHSSHTAMSGMEMTGPVMIDPELQLKIGIRTENPAYRDLRKTIRTVGRVEADETRIQVITVKWEGWVEKLYVDFVGKQVQAGEPLMELYSPELVQAQREYLLAVKAGQTFSSSKYSDVAEATKNLVEASRQRLLLWDFTEEKIRLLEEKGEPMKTILFTAPVTGTVLKKSVFQGMKVMPGESLLEIAELSRIWVVADFYEEDTAWVREGQPAEITLPYYPGQMFSGRVEFIYPVVDQRTRTVRVRFSFPNPHNLLKPGMFADISLKVSLGRHLTVPVDSVLDTGTHQIVFVDKGNGHFEPRMLTLGPLVEGYYVVLSGLSEKEKIVSNGAFLLDAESKIGGAMASMPGMQGMEMPGMKMEGKGGEQKPMPPEHKH
ncbi:MAG: efflux RND transporter periplasmic adaptor subunit [bacterium JZ-2024 1]